MSDHLLDSDVVIDLLNGSAEIAQFLGRLTSAAFSISVATVGEIVHGIERSGDSAVSRLGFDAFLNDVEVLSFDLPTAWRFGQMRARLQSQGATIGDLDLVIAATTIQHDLTLVSRIRRHFERLRDLRLVVAP